MDGRSHNRSLCLQSLGHIFTGMEDNPIHQLKVRLQEGENSLRVLILLLATQMASPDTNDLLLTEFLSDFLYYRQGLVIMQKNDIPDLQLLNEVLREEEILILVHFSLSLADICSMDVLP